MEGKITEYKGWEIFLHNKYLLFKYMYLSIFNFELQACWGYFLVDVLFVCTKDWLIIWAGKCKKQQQIQQCIATYGTSLLCRTGFKCHYVSCSGPYCQPTDFPSVTQQFWILGHIWKCRKWNLIKCIQAVEFCILHY